VLHSALAAAATLVALAAALAMWERAAARQKLHEIVWTVALLLFAAASAALWWGAAMGWSATPFRLFYLFGAIANVPALALGSYCLTASPQRQRQATVAVGALCVFAAGVMAATPVHAIRPTDLPQGSEVLPVLPRVLAATFSGVGTLVLVALCAIGAIRTTGNRRLGNIVIVVGTLTTAASGLLNSVLAEMDAFAVALACGIFLIFLGFLAATSQPADPAAATG
jgi:hypothetical protein